VTLMSENKLDVMAFGAHADDVEIGMGGTIAKLAASGKRIGIIDLTDAELSSNGTVEMRKVEAAHAAKELGVSFRNSLSLPDRGLYIKEEYIRILVEKIRLHQPQIVFAPYFEDRHPDHGNCSRLVEEAVFSSAIKKYAAGDHQQLPPHRVSRLYFYMINGFHKPDFAVNISLFMNKKIAALQAYESQFIRTDNSVDTPLVNGYIETVEARERLFGKMVGVDYAEGFMAKQPVLLNRDLLGDEI
jgi:N-acetylglucosamine malate deacetylase 1